MELVSKVIDGVLSVVIIAIIIGGFWRLIKTYFKGSSLKETRNEYIHLIVIIIMVGTVPSLPVFGLNTGEAIMKPATAIVEFFTDSVTEEVGKIKGN